MPQSEVVNATASVVGPCLRAVACYNAAIQIERRNAKIESRIAAIRRLEAF
jgi:hypothetical protein